MRIAMIAPEILPVPAVNGGAVSTYIDSVAKKLAKKHKVTVYGISDPLLPQKESSNGVNYVRVESEGKEKAIYIKNVINHLLNRGGKFDVIEIFDRPMFVLSMRESGIRVPIVLSMHTPVLPFSSPTASPILIKSIIEEVTSIITISRFLGTTISTRCTEARDKIYPIHPGVDLNIFQPCWTEQGSKIRSQLRNELQLGDAPVLFFAGRLHITKGVHVILRAMAQVFLNHPNAYLLIAGGVWFGSNDADKYVRLLHSLASRKRDQVKFLGSVSYPEISGYFLASDIFISASQWEEPLGRVHCEAMATGIPIIASNRGGIGEVVKTGLNGILINDYTNPVPYAKAIQHLLEDPEYCRSLGHQGRQLAEKRLAFDNIADKVLQVIESSVKKDSMSI